MNASINSPAWIALRNKLAQDTLDLLAEHGLKGWSVKFENVTSRAGRCNYDTKTISYSIEFMLASPLGARNNTVLHEVAHALVGPVGHGETWRQKFISLGGNGSKHSTFPQSAMTHEIFTWVGTCPNCKAVDASNRAPQSIWMCVACETDSKYERIFVWSKKGKVISPLEIGKSYAKKYVDLQESGIIPKD